MGKGLPTNVAASAFAGNFAWSLFVGLDPVSLQQATVSEEVTHVLQFPDKFTPRKLQTRPYASTKWRP